MPSILSDLQTFPFKVPEGNLNFGQRARQKRGNRPASTCVCLPLFIRGFSRLHYIQERIHGTVALLCRVGSEERSISPNLISVSKAVCSTVRTARLARCCPHKLLKGYNCQQPCFNQMLA